MTDALINVNGGNVAALDIMLLLTVITLLPTLVVMMTSFTRYVISFSFLRTAMGTQQTPPNSVLVGMALVLTLFTMTPTLEVPATQEEAAELPLQVIVPSFVTSELKTAFEIGFLLYIPFLLIDIIVSSTLMSMGMMMLPPAMISTPFKILLFILLDGWQLLFSSLVRGINW